MDARPRGYLLTGKPGSGKTTIVREALGRTGLRAGGFYTEEVRKAGVRSGFRIVTLEGEKGTLASTDLASPHRVGKYGVDIESLDRLGVRAIHRALDEADLVVVDEIGKMELLSPRFREAVAAALQSGKRLLGTIMQAPHPLADEMKRDMRVKVVDVTRDNRQVVLTQVVDWLVRGNEEPAS